MVKPTDQETTVVKQMVVILLDPKRRACHTVEGHTGSARVVRRQRERETACVRGFMVVSMRRKRRSKLNRFRII